MARAVLHYDEAVSRLVHHFKYHGHTAGLDSYRLLKESLVHLDGMEQTDFLVPVPLHLKRLRQRGFNQAVLLALALFPDLKNKVNPFLLERCRWTEPQTGLNGKQRRKNLRNAFELRHPARVEGRTILLLDDIFTTGSTVNECARTLRRAGAKEVRVLTLARVRED